MRLHAGRLSLFYKAWTLLTSDPKVLSWVKGYRLPIARTITQDRLPPTRVWSPDEKKLVQSEINRLLSIGAITISTPCSNQFISSIFLIQKPNGKHRLILNLKQLNRFLHAGHFKMEDWRMATKLLFPGAYMASLDLQDAYFLIRVCPSHRKYLRFSFDNCLYEYTCMPFGLCSAPLVFTKLMKPVLCTLRSQNLTSVAYLDDFLLIASSNANCLHNIQVTITTLEQLGFLINYGKSNLIPQTFCKFLGFCFDSINMRMHVPIEKQKDMYDRICAMSSLSSCSIRHFASFLGKLTEFARPCSMVGCIQKSSNGLNTLPY